VTSSITVLHALLWQKLSVYYEIVTENLKMRKYGYKKFLHEFYLKDDLRIKFIVLSNEMMRLCHLRYVTYIAQTRLMNNN